LEQIQEAMRPTQEYKKALEALREATRPNEQYKKYLEQIQEAMRQKDYQNALNEALRVQDLFEKNA
jgi:hypothetical protein